MSEKVKVKIARNVQHLPVVALRGLVVFPNNVVHFEVGRAKSIAAIEAAMHGNSSVFLVAQKEMDVEEPGLRDLYTYGVVAEIRQVLRVSEDLVKVLVEGKYRARLTAKLNELLGGAVADEARILTEAAIVADRLAVDEETVRLHSHIAQLRGILDCAEPVGRKLDFLVQEMNRETNTIGSKCSDTAIAGHVVEMKSEIEKIREQIQNIE